MKSKLNDEDDGLKLEKPRKVILVKRKHLNKTYYGLLVQIR